MHYKWINRYIKKNIESKVVSPLSNTLVKLMEVWSCFSEKSLKLVGLIVNITERINTKKGIQAI